MFHVRNLLLFGVCIVDLQSCVAKTRTKCKSTDYSCACLDKKYITKLTKCIGRSCAEAELHDAAWYLTSLCNSVGVPLQRVVTKGDKSTAVSEQFQLELRGDFQVLERQESFSRNLTIPTATRSTARSTSRATASDTITGATQPTSGSDNGEGGSGGLSAGTKLGLGLGIPIGVLTVAAAIILAFWFGRKTREEKAAAATATAAQTQQNYPGGPPQMMQPAYTQQPGAMAPMQQQAAKMYMPPQNGPAELSQNAQYIGHELHTQGGNTIEMPANQTPGPQNGPSPDPLGYKDSPQGFAQPQPVHPQQQYYPPPQQPANSSPAPPVGQTPYLAPQHNQAPTAAEVPERRKTPNMYE